MSDNVVLCVSACPVKPSDHRQTNKTQVITINMIYDEFCSVNLLFLNLVYQVIQAFWLRQEKYKALILDFPNWALQYVATALQRQAVNNAHFGSPCKKIQQLCNSLPRFVDESAAGVLAAYQQVLLQRLLAEHPVFSTQILGIWKSKM